MLKLFILVYALGEYGPLPLSLKIYIGIYRKYRSMPLKDVLRYGNVIGRLRLDNGRDRYKKILKVEISRTERLNNLARI